MPPYMYKNGFHPSNFASLTRCSLYCETQPSGSKRWTHCCICGPPDLQSLLDLAPAKSFSQRAWESVSDATRRATQVICVRPTTRFTPWDTASKGRRGATTGASPPGAPKGAHARARDVKVFIRMDATKREDWSRRARIDWIANERTRPGSSGSRTSGGERRPRRPKSGS